MRKCAGTGTIQKEDMEKKNQAWENLKCGIPALLRPFEILLLTQAVWPLGKFAHSMSNVNNVAMFVFFL